MNAVGTLQSERLLILDPNPRTFNSRLFGGYVVGAFAVIFYLPYLVPMHPSASDSYVFAYNNRAGILLLLLLAAIGSIWTRGLNLKFPKAGISEPVALRTLVVTLVAVLLSCLAMYMIAGRFGGFGESSYEIDRAWLLSQGRVPYVDFEWPFGIAFLYGPLFFSHLLSIGIVKAYYLFWLVNCLLGTILLFAVINLINYPTRSKNAIYLLLYASWFLSIVGMGTHYTLVRYTCPLFFILVIHKLIKDAGTKARVYATLLAVAFAVVLLLISPETAIAYAFACICIFLLTDPNRSRKTHTIFAGLLLALAAVFLAAMKLHVLDTVRASGGGADSFPISPAPHFLLFFASIFLCACYLFQRFSGRLVDDNTIGLIAFAIPMIAAALGRCDPGHVLLNGLGIFLASMFYVSNYNTAWKWHKTIFVVVFIVLSGLPAIWLNIPPIGRAGLISLGYSSSNSRIGKSLTHFGRTYLSKFGNTKQRAKFEAIVTNPQLAAPHMIDFASIYPSWHGTFLAPLGYKPNGFGTYLSNQVDYGHFEGFENANTVDAIHEKLSEIKSHPEKALLLPDHFETYCQINLPAERLEISVLFAFPYFGKAVHTESPRQPVCDYIRARYRLEQAPTPQSFGYGLWVAKSIGEGGARI
jgi:hypothetical protein